MKRTILLAYLILMTISTWAQTNYYSQTKTFVENNYIYQCNATPWGFVELYNKNNVLKGKFPAYRSNGKTYIAPEDGFNPLTKYDTQKRIRLKEIVSNLFTKEQKAFCMGSRLYVTCYLNSNTGKIDEVLFEFFKNSGYTKIPVSVFREIEVNLKRELQFEVTDMGEQLNFIFYCVPIEI